MKPIRAFLMLALPLLLPFGVAQAAPHDATAAEGDLQVVCKDFTISSALLLSAKCNKKGDSGTLSLTDTSYDLGAHFVFNCPTPDREQRIDVTADAVKLVVTCQLDKPGGGTDTEEVDTVNLTDTLTWDTTTGWSRKNG